MTTRIAHISGPALVLPGDDVDTDRIIPARFLKAITFEGLEAHVFEDDRIAATAAGTTHPFDDPARHEARVLIVGSNFGCGSSREHAPQAIARRGIAAVVGESFGEIFFGNALAIGLPCVAVSLDDAKRLRQAVVDPLAIVDVDVDRNEVRAGALTVPALLPASTRDAWLTGSWDATGLLLEDYDQVVRTARALPYVSGFFTKGERAQKE
jgi:3-isopropylmalate/(R)-2-methylmalate dehydratase small subunit